MPNYPDLFNLCRHQDTVYSLWENPRFLLGFSEERTSFSSLRSLFPCKPFLLRQIHSAIIHRAEASLDGCVGDGWLVKNPKTPVMIQTADCVPLFFWSEQETIGGILHVGWRGWHQEIERNLVRQMEKEGANIRSMHFLFGPAIERNCYEVGEDVRSMFQGREWIRPAFFFVSPGRYRLDLKEGIRLSLIHAGIEKSQIEDSGLCTFCLKERFPSYRRDGRTGERIFHFFMWQ